MSVSALSIRIAAAAALSVAFGTPALAAAGAATRPALAQKQLVSGTNCQTAAHPPAKRPDFLADDAEYRADVLITTRYCSATAHNQVSPANPEIVVVSADPSASGGNKIFVRTVPESDANKVREACIVAAKAAAAYVQPSTAAPPQTDAVIAGSDVVTGTGKVDCEGYLRATPADNPLVVLAPGAISGSAISVHILDMIGVRKPAAEVQAAVDDLGHRVALSVASSADEIRKRPQIVLGPAGLNQP